MVRKFLALLFFLIGISSAVLGQFYPTQYRPPNQQWQFLQTPHFKLIYAKGNDSTARQMGQILEQQYPLTQNLVGGKLDGFPVILNDYNDRSNGYVTPLHFRSEIELPPIKGKILNPRTGGWLENVGPHELVHAMQFNNLGDYNIPRLVNLFSPDLARAFHGMIPSGITEGIAVYHETKNVTANGGRGNFPIFTNQFEAIFDSDRRWSMGQTVTAPGRTRPFNRHYVGGYAFTSWLHNTYGPQTTRKALDFYMDWPFLGYGVALRHVTGQWPGQLYEHFGKAQQDTLSEIASSSTKNKLLDIPYKGREIRRPKWLSDSNLIFYGSFYNARSGFYTYNLKSNVVEHILTTNTVEDFRYDLSQDRSQMVYSYYDVDPIYDNTYKSELVRYHFSSKKTTQLCRSSHLYAPTRMGDSLLALRNSSASSQLVSLKEEAIIDIAHLNDSEVIAMDWNPKKDKLAVVINKEGRQALWIADPSKLNQQLQGDPAIAFSNGSIYDPEWHPNGNRLLFSSDFSGTHQIYEYNMRAESVTQVSQSPYNAFEGSYSPDGNRIAFVRQVENERLPAIIQRDNFDGKSVESSMWRFSVPNTTFQSQAAIADSIIMDSNRWSSGTYASGLGWLKPRTVLPVFEEVGNQGVYQGGVSFHSNNTLANQSYSAEVTYLEDRGWYDISYQNKTFYPGFKVRLFSEPAYRAAESVGTLLRQERSLALSIPFRLRLNQNIYSTSLFLEPEVRRSQVRFFDVGGNSETEFTTLTVANLFGQLNYRLQQNIRDLQPNSGLILFSELETIASGKDISLDSGGESLTISSQGGTALQGGLFGFVSPFRKWNQSLRVGVEGLTQSGLIFGSQSLVSDAFSEPILAGSENLISVSSRYTIPLIYPDDGGFLLPFYLSNIYLVAFSNTVTDPTFNNWYRGSRSVFGVGVRAQFRFSNLGFNIGLGYGYEPSRKKSRFFIGDF